MVNVRRCFEGYEKPRKEILGERAKVCENALNTLDRIGWKKLAIRRPRFNWEA